MNLNQFADNAKTVGVMARTFAVNAALRRGRVFLQSDATVGLLLPKGEQPLPYKDAARSVLMTAGLAEVYHATMVVESARSGYLWEDIEENLATKTAVVVIIPHDAVIPPKIAIALDRIVPVGEIRPTHLAAAILSATGIRASTKDAKALLEYPADVMFSAFRKGRSIDTVLSRLKASKEQEPRPEVSGLRIEDLPGFGQAKDWALNLAVDLGDWKAGTILWSDVDRGLLLSGPPGVGKSMFAGAVARTCGAKLITTSAAQWQAAGHLGDFLKAMRKSFREAADARPSILFIDEFDALGDRSKFSGSNASYGVQVVNGVLEAMDGSTAREGVVVIAATNHAESIDPALRRPGRLDRHVVVGLPDLDDRRAIMSLHLGADLPAEALAAAARATTGYSGADIAQLARDARRVARRDRRKVEARDLAAVSPPVLVIPLEIRRASAFHEAGHAIVGLELDFGSITAIVVPQEVPARGDSLGYVEWTVSANRHRPESSYRNEIAMLFGGMAAEMVVLGQPYSGAGGGHGSDLKRATDLATIMVGCLGMGALTYHHAETHEDLAELRNSNPAIRKLVEELLSDELERSISIIERRRDGLELIVESLTGTEVLTGDRIREILAHSHRE